MQDNEEVLAIQEWVEAHAAVAEAFGNLRTVDGFKAFSAAWERELRARERMSQLAEEIRSGKRP